MDNFTKTHYTALHNMFNLLDQMRDIHASGNFDKTFAEFLQACANAEKFEEVSVD